MSQSSTPVPAAPAPVRDDGGAAERRRARRVTYGSVALLLVVAVAQVELWPLTSFRLFSHVRTGEGQTLRLVATAPDGQVVPVPVGARSGGSTAHRLKDLAGAEPEAAREMVDGWLELAGVDPADVRTVRLERELWELDPVTLERRTVAVTVLVEVER
ncbi:hypothetical protein DNL40_13115 [Xylanimonas oleitrophica]|uniref:Uncharacterized protein n=1 Tax=Xylanimonas oleitrophica TaxID=2607479 RepID=A0A2W5WWD7_9MICO|nr:hypothetical protein [Xylanimonas oleitrophica]PZR52145.1 hypothetical protein DNL40_13115 [Xylanimonas oleitrophica]